MLIIINKTIHESFFSIVAKTRTGNTMTYNKGWTQTRDIVIMGYVPYAQGQDNIIKLHPCTGHGVCVAVPAIIPVLCYSYPLSGND